MLLALKSGTDQYHGEVFEFNRNTALDASTFFANASRTSKPALNFNDYGFNLGGPNYLPGRRKKLFFFLNADRPTLGAERPGLVGSGNTHRRRVS
jgi:hypothetical protein